MTHFRRFGFLYILLFLFLGSWIGQFYTQMEVVMLDAREHGDVFYWSEFWPQFFAATFENWQSEFLQLLVQALGMYVLAQAVFQKSEEDMRRIERKIDRLLRIDIVLGGGKNGE